MMSVVKGRLLGLGVGPGDPELITLKALRQAARGAGGRLFRGQGQEGQRLRASLRRTWTRPSAPAAGLSGDHREAEPPLCYETIISDFYDTAAEQLAAHLDAGRDVAVICEGDPFFYGSYMYLHDRLATATKAKWCLAFA